MNQKPRPIEQNDRCSPAFIVCSNPRSGSGLFCDFLENTGVFGSPDIGRRFEAMHLDRLHGPGHFDWDQQHLDAYFELLFAEHGWFKMHWHQMADLVRCVRNSRRYRKLTAYQISDYLPDSTRLIFLYREDKVQQAASMIKALASRRWSIRKSENMPEVDLSRHRTSLYAICYQIEEALRNDRLWYRFFDTNQLKYFPCSYEELVIDKRAVIAGSLEFLGFDTLDGVTIQTERIKQADAFNEAIVRQYNESNRHQRRLYHFVCRIHLRLKAWIADHLNRVRR